VYVDSNSSSSPASAGVAARETRLTAVLVAGALLVGAALQVFIPPGPLTLVAASALAGAVVIVLSIVNPGRLRETISGFRFTSTLLVVLAIFAVLGTLILQRKPMGFYEERYGAIAGLIVALRLDDIFHGLPFAGLMALFGAAVIASAALRWPLKLRNAGFFVCHVGLLTSLGGAAASATLSIRGRIDLHAGGETATGVRVTKSGMAYDGYAPLGFELKLDKFDLVNYETEYRIGYYEQGAVRDEDGLRKQWRLKASFDPDTEKHRLPSGDSFRLTGVWPDFEVKPSATQRGPDGSPALEYASASQEWKKPVVRAVLTQDGQPKEKLLRADPPDGLFIDQDHALVFEKREKEVKSYLSTVTASNGQDTVKAVVSVNDPLSFAGWTLYQVNYNPQDPTYSGLEAVHDPGVPWVFAGFGLISLGVFSMFYVDPRFKGKKAPAAS
jgi:hypothetical protein